ncbi:MAG: PEGA domain-containing protein [Treponema sp.]|jgi:hypothetical protein|nr:PEGA domain-containing protein [Treponema sp.]
MEKVISLLLIAVMLAGCQTTTKVNINTNVPDASVTVDGRLIGNTPLQKVKIKNSSGKSYRIIIEKEGYETFRGALATEIKSANAVAIGVGYVFSWLLLPMFLWINALWIEGPQPNQYFILEEAAQTD